VKGVDDNLDRFFAYLKEKGLWDNTVIIYTSDQGMMLGEHDFEDKRWMYEESIRIPLIIKVPGLTKNGSRSKLLVNNADFAPTILELAGGEVPDYMQGRSLVPILSGEDPADWRTSSYYRYWMHMVHHDIPAHFGIRTQRYKLIFFYARYFDLEKEGSLSMYWLDEAHSNKVLPTPVAWELYDLEKDPHEVNNVYNDPAYTEVVRELKDELARQRAELKEEDGSFPHLQEIIDAHWDD
jgi:arylsulfatase A-like enzyme